MLCIAFIEPSGNLISSPNEPWRDEAKETSRSRTPTRSGGPVQLSGTAGGVGSDAHPSDDQYTVMVSEKQARVVSLPSQTCLYRVNLSVNDSTFAVTANVVSLKGGCILFFFFISIQLNLSIHGILYSLTDGPCLATFLSNGHIQVFSLPSLRPLMDVEFTPLVELRYSLYSSLQSRSIGFILN